MWFKEWHLHLNFNWSYQFVLNVEILRYKNSPQHFKEMTMLNMWQQLYDPLDNIWLSSAVALIPIIFFFWPWLFSFKRQYCGYGHSYYCITDCTFSIKCRGKWPLHQSFTVSSTVYGQFHGSLLGQFFYTRFR